MTTPDNESITRFVRDTLGCNCPAEVFERIEFTRLPPEGDGPHARVIVGGKLLIYIHSLDGDSVISDAALATLTRHGIDERDSTGLNRFRLVLASADPEHTLEAASHTFKMLRGCDVKVHLHTIAADDPILDILLK